MAEGGRNRHWLLAITGGAVLSLFLVAKVVQRVQTEHPRPRPEIQMKTLCVGRYLIDLPSDAEVTINGGFIGGFNISSMVESDDQFKGRVRTIGGEIAGARDEQGRPSLELTKPVSLDSAKGKVLVYNRQPAKAYVSGRIVEDEDFSVRGILRFPGLTIAGDAHRQALERGDELARLFARLRPLDGGEIPREPGFCIDHTIVRDPYEKSNTEGVVMFAGLPGHPDVSIMFSSMAGTAPAQGLLERNALSAGREPFYMRLAFTTLRERRRTLNGVQGEELAQRVRELNVTTGYSFQWEADGKQDDVYAPALSLELQSGANPVSGGKPVQSSLSEGQMTELWERIVRSIRVRPVESGKGIEQTYAMAPGA